jgi:hypothetical protein
MKTELITYAFAASLTAVLLAEPAPLKVTKQPVQKDQVDGELHKPDAAFRIRPENENPSIPELSIPTYTTMRSRVVDIRQSESRMEVAIQVDELGIAYYDYKLENGKWILKGTKNVCALSGALAQALAQVDILDDGRVEVAYRSESLDRRSSSWADELLSKENQGKAGLMKEEYKLKDGQFVLSGEPVRLRPAVPVNAQNSEEQNKAQHPTDGTPVPEKPKE